MTHAEVNDEEIVQPGVLSDLRWLVRGQKGPTTAVIGAAVVAAVSEAFLLASIVQSVSALSAGHTSLTLAAGAFQFHGSVSLVLGLAVVAALLRAGASAVLSVFSAKIVAAGRARQRHELINAYLSADWATQSADKSGRLLQTFTSSVSDANAIMIAVLLAVPALVTCIALVGVSFVLDPVITAAICSLGVVMALVVRPLSNQASMAAKRDVLARQETASHVAGIIAAAPELNVLGARGGALVIAGERIDDAEREFGRTQMVIRLVGVSVQSLALLGAASGILILSVIDPSADFAVVGTIAVLLLRVAGLGQVVQTATSAVGGFRPFAREVRDQIAGFEQRRSSFGDRPFPVDFTLRLDGLSYTYPGSAVPALVAEEITIPRGSFVAVVGPSGAGKSTFIQVLLRMRKANRGTLKFGQVLAEDISESEFTRTVAFVPQAPHLVPGTIADNIALYRTGISREDIVEASRQAHIHEEIMATPLGYETRLDAQVDELSGGQKQRLALARALVGSPRVLVVDEPTSALDRGNEDRVIETLMSLRGEQTVVMVTHRMSSISRCDAVYDVVGGMMSMRPTMQVSPGQAMNDPSDHLPI